MKLLTFQQNGQYVPAFAAEDGKTVWPLSVLGIGCASVQEVIEQYAPAQLSALAANADLPAGIPLEEVTRCAPIPQPRQDVICLGINYMAHAAEADGYNSNAFGGERPYPIYFAKRVDEAVPDGGMIQGHTDLVTDLDYECELAVVIGKTADRVAEADAYDYVFGYTILNDISARTLQTRHKQWYFGKSLDGFTPIGPWIVTADQIPGKPALPIRSYVNGELRQNSNTSLLINDIAHVISELSQGIKLKPGTIIAMGTPAGVGMGFKPPKWLKPGDEVICEVEGIGTLTNIVAP